MKLKSGVNLNDFLAEINKCQNDVIYFSSQGDRLNLKSVLSQFILVAASQDRKFVNSGDVVCDNPLDYEMLKAFLQ